MNWQPQQGTAFQGPPLSGYEPQQIPQGGPFQAPPVQPGVQGTPIVQPFYSGQPQYAMPQTPAFVPQPLPGQQQPNAGFPAPWPTQQAPTLQQPPMAPSMWPQQQQPQRVQLTDSTILDGPTVPAHLRGRTWGQVRQLQSGLEQEYIQRNQTPAGASLSALPTGYPQQQPQRPPQGGNFWQNPEQRVAEIVGQTIQQTVLPALQPMMQQSFNSAAQQAEAQARASIADFAYLEQDIRATLAAASPEARSNPALWEATADLVRGQKMRSGQYAPQQPPRGALVAQPTQSQGLQAVPAYSPPATHTFFTEGPTTPSVAGYGQPAVAQMTQDDHIRAQQFGMTPQQWLEWKGSMTVIQGGQNAR